MKKKTLALFSAAVMAAAAMTGCSNNTAPTSPSTEETTKAPEAPSTEAAAETAAEEQKKELVILGGNGAGLIAAIQAAEDGINPSKILILSGSGELAADMKILSMRRRRPSSLKQRLTIHTTLSCRIH